MSKSSQLKSLDSLGPGMVGVGVLVAPLWIGAVHWPVAMALGVWMVVAAIVTSISRARASKSGVRISVYSGVFLVGAFWSALQIVPWPAFLVKWLSPGRWAAHELAMQHGIIEAQSFLMPSLDPGASADMAWRFVALGALVWAIENASTRARQGRALMATVGISALLSLLVGVIQVLVSPGLFLGFYEAERAPILGSTFVNANQASALCALGAYVWMVLATGRGVKRQRYRAAYALCALMCVVGVGLQESVGVWLALGASALCAGAYYGLVRKGQLVSKKARFGVIGVIVVAWCAGWMGAVWGGLSGSLGVRAEMVRAAFGASRAYAVLGSGAWSVERTIGPYLRWDIIGMNRVETIEAEVLEWVLTLGWPMAALMWLGLLVSWCGPLWRDQLRARRGAAAFGVGVLVLALAQMHFPFFMLGLGLPAVMAWAACREQALVTRQRVEASDDRSTPVPQGRSRWEAWATGRKISYRRALAVLGLVVVICVVSTARLGWSPGRVFNTDINAMNEQELRAIAVALPGEPQVYVRWAATRAEEDVKEQEALYHTAYTLEPTRPYKVLWARALWRMGERERASAMFTEVIQVQGSRAYRRGLAVMLETVTQSDERAAIVEPVGEKRWEATWRLIDRVEGEIYAQEFLQAMTGRRPKDVVIHMMLLDFYVEKKRWELLDMYAQLLSMWKFEDVQRGQDMVLRAKFLSLKGRGDARAEQFILSQAKRFAASTELAPYLLSLTPVVVKREDREDYLVELEHAHERVCQGDSAVKWRDACEVHRAWSFEAQGNLERAEQLWKSRARRLGQWDALGEYYERHGLCTSLRLLVKQASQGVVKHEKLDEARRKRLIKGLEARYARCSNVE